MLQGNVTDELKADLHKAAKATAWKIRGSLDVLWLILFIPYMFYWNLIGFRF